MTDQPVPVLLRRLDEGLPAPGYAHPGDAGVDLYAAQEGTIEPGARLLIGTGIALALPAGFVALVHPRSGLAAKHGITVLNAPGTIDAGYRGEIKVCLLNTDQTKTFSVQRGDRVAQLVVQPVPPVSFIEVERLPGSHRGDSGHGSTGGFITASPSTKD